MASVTSEYGQTRPLSFPIGASLLGLIALASLGLISGGFFAHAHRGLQGLALVTLAGADLWLLGRRFGLLGDPAESKRWESLFAGLFALLSLDIALRYAGAGADQLQPLFYALVAYLATVNPRRERTLLIGAALLIIALPFFTGHPQGLSLDSLGALAMRIAFTLAFATLFVIFHRAPVNRTLMRYRSHLRARERRSRQRGVELELDQAPQERRAHQLGSAVEACEQSSDHMVRLVRHGVHARTAVLLWLDAKGENLMVRSVATSSKKLRETPFPVGSGVLGGIAREKSPLQLHDIRPSFKGIPYYKSGEEVGAFLGVPVIEQGKVRGFLCVDRAKSRPFGPADEQLLQDAAAQILRTLRNERTYLRTEQTKFELGRFYEASSALSKSLGLAEVLNVALETVSSIADFDEAAIALVDEKTQEIVLSKAAGSRFASSEGLRFAPNTGLLSQALKMRHYLPVGSFRREKTYLFDGSESIKGLRSFLVLPLISQDQVIGGFVLAAEASATFTRERREMLEVVSNQVAVAVANAQIYAEMERLATTDGLTQLLNRRTFYDRFEEALARVDRAASPATLILTDIDFFKKVNDTYGHTVGDEVLKGVVEVFRNTLRRTDTVGRYGGEEFIIVLEDTDLEGGIQMAERLRRAVEEQVFDSDRGSFGVTISLGLSQWRVDTEHREKLVELADEALYACKEKGRNRAIAWSQIEEL